MGNAEVSAYKFIFLIAIRTYCNTNHCVYITVFMYNIIYNIGLRTLLHLEHCVTALAEDYFGSYNFLFSTVVIVGIIVVSLCSLYCVCEQFDCSTKYKRRILLCVSAFTGVACVLVFLSLLIFSFSLSTDIYSSNENFRNGLINCTSSVFYSTYTSLVLTHTTAALAVFIGVVICIAWICVKLTQVTMFPETMRET